MIGIKNFLGGRSDEELWWRIMIQTVSKAVDPHPLRCGIVFRHPRPTRLRTPTLAPTTRDTSTASVNLSSTLSLALALQTISPYKSYPYWWILSIRKNVNRSSLWWDIHARCPNSLVLQSLNGLRRFFLLIIFRLLSPLRLGNWYSRLL